jgi:hypothetical protein
MSDITPAPQQLADEISDNAFKALVTLRFANLEKLCVLDGATLALSFSGLSAIRAAAPFKPIYFHYFVSIAWLFFICSIVLSLTSNWLAVLSVKSKEHFRTFHKINEVINLLHESLSSVSPSSKIKIDDPPETRTKSNKKYTFWQNTEKASDGMGWAAQVCTIVGLIILSIFFTENMP